MDISRKTADQRSLNEVLVPEAWEALVWIKNERARRCLAALFGAMSIILATAIPQGYAAPTANVASDSAAARAGQPAAAPTAAAWPNRVMTWNLDNPDKGPDSQYASEIAKYKPQVIGVQESCVDQVQGIRDELERRYGLKYNIAYGSVLRSGVTTGYRCGKFPAGGAYGNAILSAAAIIDPENHTYGVGGSEERGWMAVTTRIDGRQVRLFNTHLAEKDQADVRAKQVKILEAKARLYDRAIIVGDFNSQPTAPELRPLWTSFRDADPACLPYSLSGCKGTHRVGKKFDYILLRKPIPQPGVGVHPSPYSDHRLVHADVSLAGDYVPPDPAGTSKPLDLPPTVNAGPDAHGDEGSAVTLRGSASDDHGAPALRWRYTPGVDVDDGTTCRFGDARQARSSFTCTDDGTFTITRTADDGVNPPVTDTATVRLRNVAPTLHLTRPAPWSVSRAGEQSTIRATFTDPGSNDTHTCSISWDGGGKNDKYGAPGENCNRPHTFTDPGMYNTVVSVNDDDGGEDSASVMLIVYDPIAGLVASAGTLAWPGARGSNSPTGTDVAALAKYPGMDSAKPFGAVAFHVNGSDMQFSSTALQWLVITPNGKAAVKGTGRMNDRAGYGFLAYVWNSSFRIVVWPLSRSSVPPVSPLYDNRRGASYDVDSANPQSLSAGVSVIDTGWIPGIPAVNGDLGDTLRKYLERMPKNVTIEGILSGLSGGRPLSSTSVGVDHASPARRGKRGEENDTGTTAPGKNGTGTTTQPNKKPAGRTDIDLGQAVSILLP